ncbi:HhH-GPD superfamily base excision DNA repair protein [Hypoxylon sp. FL1857]|nr:HhH-GPD superfamily base excision DNA repair protein [Hypoxylon sp. FL1857]
MSPRGHGNFLKGPFYITKLIRSIERTIANPVVQRLISSYNGRGYRPHLPTFAILNRHRIANMATRRSARLSAISTASKSVIEPPPPPASNSKGRKRKTAPAVSEKEGTNGALEEGTAAAAPTTPKRRRVQKPVAPVPTTPTPSNAQLMSEPVTAHETPKPKPAAVRRLADPNVTNAMLLSPETSRVVTRAVSPSKASVDQPTTTNILEEACKHLISVDERLKPLIEKHRCSIFSAEGLSEKIDPFESLASGIISQQVSGAAAKAIKQRFIDLFDNDGKFPHPSQVAACTIEQLRSAGFSQRKAEYVKGLAEKFTSGELSAQLLVDAPYEVVVEKLIAVRGLGLWSVEMFACFGLKRMDVFSLGDLGVQRGMAAFVGRDVAKLKNKGGKWKYMSENEMREISAKFAPYRSVFMWYMWKAAETDVVALE